MISMGPCATTGPGTTRSTKKNKILTTNFRFVPFALCDITVQLSLIKESANNDSSVELDNV
jgi:hypothetical protein